MLADFLLFTFFSTFEYVAILVLMFVLFRLKFTKYAFHFMFVAISISYVSYTTRHDDLASISPIVQMLVLFLFIWLMFRIQVFYALIMTVTSYLSFALIQGIFIFFLKISGMITLDQLQPNTVVGWSIQTGTAALTIMISLMLNRLHIGFNFVPHSEFAPTQLRRENMTFLVIIIVSILTIGLTYYIAFQNQSSGGFVLGIIITICSLLLLFYLAIRKERDDHD